MKLISGVNGIAWPISFGVPSSWPIPWCAYTYNKFMRCGGGHKNFKLYKKNTKLLGTYNFYYKSYSFYFILYFFKLRFKFYD